MIKGAVTVVLALVAFGLALVATGASGQDGTTADGTTAARAADATTASPSTDENVLRIGWAQDPDTLNPFVGQNEEDYTVWALNWDLPINFSPKTLGPAPGIAESWEVSDDRKTVTMKLAPDMKWSDGKPITSKDVKWSLDELGGHGVLFAGYTSSITRIETPDPETVVIHTKRPDARVIGGLFVYVLPEHIWGKVPAEAAQGPVPAEAADRRQRPVRRHRVRAPQDHHDGAEPELAGRARRLRQGPVHQVRQPGRGRAGPRPRRDRPRPRGRVLELRPPRRAGQRLDAAQPTPAYTQLSFNLCPERLCPGRPVQPGRPGPDRAPGDRLRSRPQQAERDRDPRHLVRRQWDPAVLLQVVLRDAGADVSVRPRPSEPDARRRGLGAERRRRP